MLALPSSAISTSRARAAHLTSSFSMTGMGFTTFADDVARAAPSGARRHRHFYRLLVALRSHAFFSYDDWAMSGDIRLPALYDCDVFDASARQAAIN